VIHGQRSWANHPVGEAADLGDESPRKLRGLKRDIIKRGRIVVPVIKDKLGNILEGKIPQEIADELGYTLAGLSDQEKQEVRVMLNLARRQMTREQIRGLNGKLRPILLTQIGWSQKNSAPHLPLLAK
jgi:hypothetical protein